MTTRVDAALELDISAALRRIGDLQSQAARATSNLPVTVDTSALQSQIEAAVAAVNTRLAVGVDTTALQGEVGSAVAGVDATVQPGADTTRVTGEITSAVAGSTARVPVTADTTAVRGEITSAVAGTTARVPVTADTTAAEAQIGGIANRAPTVRVPVEADTSQAQAQLGSLGNAGEAVASRLGASFGGASAGVGALTSGLSGATAATLGLAGAAGVAGGQFESSFARMEGLAGVAAAEIEGLQQSVAGLAPAVGIGPQALAEGLYFIESAGLRATSSLDVLTISARASASGLGETQTVANALTGVIASYGEANITAADAADIFVATVREGKAEASDLAGQMGRVAPIAASLGVEFGEVGGALAFLTTVSGDTGQAVTGLASLMRNLALPSQQAREALAEVGLTVEDIRATVAERGLLAALQQLDTAFQGNSESLGRVISDQQGFLAALALTGPNASNAAASIDSVTNATGSLDTAFAAISDTAGFRVQQALARLQVTAVQLGSAALPAVGAAAAGAGAALGAVGAIVGAIPPEVLQLGVSFVLLNRALNVVSGPVRGIIGLFTGVQAASAITGVALAGLAAGIAAYMAVSQRQAAVEAANEASVRSLSAAYDDLSLSLTEVLRAQEGASVALGDPDAFWASDASISVADLTARLGEAGVTLGDVSEGLLSGASAADILRGSIDQVTSGNIAMVAGLEAYVRLQNEAAQAEIGRLVFTEELSNAQASAALALTANSDGTLNYVAALNLLRDQLQVAGTAATAMDAAIQKVGESTVSMLGPLGQVGDELSKFREKADLVDFEGFEGLGGPLRDAADAASELNSELDLLFDRLFGVQNAEDEIAATVDRLTASLEENGVQFEAQNEAGREQRDLIEDLVRSHGDYIASLAREGASQAEVAAAAERSAFMLSAQLQAMGLSRGEADRLAASLLGIPDVSPEVKLQGAKEAEKEAQAAAASIAQLDKQEAKAEFTLEVLDALRQAELAKQAMKGIPDVQRQIMYSTNAQAESARASKEAAKALSVQRQIAYYSNATLAANQASKEAAKAQNVARSILYGTNATAMAAQATKEANKASSVNRLIGYSTNAGSMAASAAAQASAAPNITRTITYYTRVVGAIATGGPVFPGMAYVAGELRPELAMFGGGGSALLGAGGPELVRFAEPANVAADAIRGAVDLARSARLVTPTRSGGDDSTVMEVRALRNEVSRLRAVMEERGTGIGELHVHEVAGSPLATARAIAARTKLG